MRTSHTIRAQQKKFEINGTKSKGGCQSGRKVVTQNSKSNLPLVILEKIEQKKNSAYQTFASLTIVPPQL